MKGTNNMGRKLSEILKDRNCFSEEQEQAIQKAVAEEVKKYTKNESFSFLNEKLDKFVEEFKVIEKQTK